MIKKCSQITVMFHKITKQTRDMQIKLPDNFGAFLTQIPLTTGLPLTPSNLITMTPSSFIKTLKLTSCNGLLAPTTEKISKSDRTCHIHQQQEHQE